MELDGILCIEGKPTVYFKEYAQPLLRKDANAIHQQCWNQGVATLLVLQDPHQVYLYSTSAKPSNHDTENNAHAALVDVLEKATSTLESYQLVSRIASGQLYRERKEIFKPEYTVDRYLIDNLGAVCDELSPSQDAVSMRRVHAFLGRLIFTCYLIDREIIKLGDYHFINRNKGNIHTLLDLFETYSVDQMKGILYKLFRSLKREFNGSMFDQDLEEESQSIRIEDMETLRRFLRGEAVGSQQMTLGFWAYDFSVIPVETISAIYENFLAREDLSGKIEKGAFYTPKNLAEMTVEEAIDGETDLLEKRFLDPSCGSGIFLVVLFNRLAEEWRFQHPRATFKKKKVSLIQLLRYNLLGVDVNETACRITCFSLYIALLDQFDPPTLRDLKKRGDQDVREKFLPRILAHHWNEKLGDCEATVCEGNFFDPELTDKNDFDYVIGNPPWVGRGKSLDQRLETWLLGDENPLLADAKLNKTSKREVFFPQKQTSHAFMWKATLHAKPGGKIALVLPSEVLLNQTDAFQAAYLKEVTAERILQLADYSFFLFSGAMRPCFIGLFQNTPCPEGKHLIEYLVPKVMRQDPRPGLVVISGEDRKWIDVRDLKQACDDQKAAMLWKSRLWGTSRDLKFLDFLNELSTLDDIAGKPSEKKRWVKGRGFKPWYCASYERNPETYGKPKPIPGTLTDRFINTNSNSIDLFTVEDDCSSLEDGLNSMRCKGHGATSSSEKLMASYDGFHRSPEKRLFQPPLVLINNGFSKFSYVDFPVFYQDSMTGISGGKSDKALLVFFTVYIGSKLASYYQFHTSGNWGTERDKVLTHELMRLPFPLPESEDTHPEAQSIIDEIASSVLALKADITQAYAKEKKQNESGADFELRSESLANERSSRIEALQKRLEPLVYRYFNLSDEEIALIEDTAEIYEPSSTPSSWHSDDIPTLEPTNTTHQKRYARTLIDILNHWSKNDQPKGKKPPFYFTAEFGTFSGQGLTWVKLLRSKTRQPPKAGEDDPAVAKAFAKLSKASLGQKGVFEYLRGIIYSDNEWIYIVKPDLRGKWTRTAALNDADTLLQAILNSKKKR